MRFVDSHNHLQDPRLDGARSEVLSACVNLGIVCSVVNGTSPTDWPEVTKLAQLCSWIIPSYGVHPWYLANLVSTWRDDLIAELDARPSAVGEIGIDHWKDGINRELQEQVFVEQLAIARARNLPVTIHGLKAWERLLELLTIHGVPLVGFLLHSYSGPAHLVSRFAELGGYFSCAPAFFHPSRVKKLSVFAGIPRERLLPESDAPDQAPPIELDNYVVEERHGTHINHPGNIRVVYDGLSALLGIPIDDVSTLFEENFNRLFGSIWKR